MSELRGREESRNQSISVRLQQLSAFPRIEGQCSLLDLQKAFPKPNIWQEVPINDNEPTLDNYWRSVILFGRNVASYKFALARSLLELAPAGQEIITLERLAEAFSRHICEHLKSANRQATSGISRFLDACRQFNTGNISRERLVDTTVQLGFNNIIDAFHVVHDGDIAVRFFTDERRGREKGIRLTQDLQALCEQFQFRNLPDEVEARWRLVETAWELNLPKSTLAVQYESTSDMLTVETRMFERRQITGCRTALNGYQKGRCFYCFDQILVESGSQADDLADVDHFFLHVLKPHLPHVYFDGIWNLVLACRSCNRGVAGKFAQIPTIRILERLHRRNNFLIDSHHPLRETLIQQTGRNEASRAHFLQARFNEARQHLISLWEPAFEREPMF